MVTVFLCADDDRRRVWGRRKTSGATKKLSNLSRNFWSDSGSIPAIWESGFPDPDEAIMVQIG